MNHKSLNNAWETSDQAIDGKLNILVEEADGAIAKTLDHLKRNKGKYAAGLGALGAAGAGTLAAMSDGEAEPTPELTPEPQSPLVKIAQDRAADLRDKAAFNQDEADYNKDLDAPDTNVDWAKEKANAASKAEFAQGENDYNKDLDAPDTNVDWAKEKADTASKAEFAQGEADYNKDLNAPDTNVDWAGEKAEQTRMARAELLNRQNRGIFDDSIKDARDSVQASIQGLKTGASQTVASLGNEFGNAVDDVKADLGSRWQNTGIPKAATDISNAVGGVRDSVVGAGNEALDKFGKYIDSGTAERAKADAADAAQEAKANALSAANAAKTQEYNQAVQTAKAGGFDMGRVFDSRDQEYLLSAEKQGLLTPAEKTILAHSRANGSM